MEQLQPQYQVVQTTVNYFGMNRVLLSKHSKQKQAKYYD